MVRIGDPHPQGTLAVAQSLAALGLQVLPARYKDKAPIVKWADYQDKRTDSLLPTWFSGGALRNYWVMTGRMSGYVVVDADSDSGDAWWREQIGDEIMNATAQVKTSKGTHYWFALPDDWSAIIQSWAVHPENKLDLTAISFDFRADGTGVIVPPSVHETGLVYAWTIPLEEACAAPSGMLDGSVRAGAPRVPHAVAGEPAGGTRSILAQLLQHPPQGDGSGRNDWLTKVAGHYAKQNHIQRDLYDLHTKHAYDLIEDKTGFSDAEFEKTIESIWRGEHERNSHRALDETCGWLQSGGTRLMTQIVRKDPANDEHKIYDLAEYANFDLQAKGVMLDEKQGRTYWVQIIRKSGEFGLTETIDAVLPANVTGDDKALRMWLANFACSALPPENMWPRTGSVGVRLQRYLESQHAPSVTVTNCLGWDADILDGNGGFVTHTGIITASKFLTCEEVGVRPNPHLLSGGTAPHQYGFSGDAEEARRVLEEVLTFHDEIPCSVFGAWWAACLVKPQIEARTSLFPFMAIEAASETGKTNGFFDLMTQLNGNTRGEMAPTKAALRDMAAANRNGIVWIDDLDDPGYLMELLRAATSGGSLTKMGEDRVSVKNTPIVSPIVISGENLGLGSQKALLDRAIILKVGSPTHRKSRHTPSQPQWDDILALRREYPRGLSDLAGWLVQAALDAESFVLTALADSGHGAGRSGDKAAILRAGARLLDHLVSRDDAGRAAAWNGLGQHALRVEEWLAPQLAAAESQYAENTLTLQILPWAVRYFGFPDKPKAGVRTEDTDTPVFIKDRRVEGTIDFDPELLEIWFHVDLLAEAWGRAKRGPVEQRTETAGALVSQADSLTFNTPGKQWRIVNGGTRKLYYRRISGSLAENVIERARGL